MIAPKKIIIKIAVETMFSLKIDMKPGNWMSSILLEFFLFPNNFLDKYEKNAIPNICW